MKLRISVSPSDAVGTGWHGTLSDAAGDLGRIRVGPTGLGHRLAVLVGMPFAVCGTGERVAATVAALETLDDGESWFSATFAVDPIGAAAAMLRQLDELRARGWDGRSLSGSPRLNALSRLRACGLPPGLPDAVHGLAHAVAARDLPVQVALHLEQPRAAFEPVWQRVFAALEARGNGVHGPPETAALAEPGTDLGALQRALLGESGEFSLRGDGSVRILTGEAPWEAAALACVRGVEHDTWCLSSEAALLDRIRGRFGLPRFGASDASRWRPALQVLPLVLSLQVGPQDPQLAYELLTLPIAAGVEGARPPRAVPGALGRGLTGALRSAPAVGGPVWKGALERGLLKHQERYPDADVDALRARIEGWFPSEPPLSVPAGELAGVARDVGEWLRGRGGSLADPVVLVAASVARDVAASLDRFPADRELDGLQIGQLVEVGLGEGVALSSRAEAGAPPCVGGPECVPRGVPGVVWFGLVAGAAEAAAAQPWSGPERAELEAAGVLLPASGAVRRDEEAAWVRAVCSARERLTVVAWETAGGEPVEPHPFLDLWQARLGAGSIEAVTTRAADLLARADVGIAMPVPPSPAVAPRAVFRLEPGRVDTARGWSASAMESLLSCPLRWTFGYAAGLRESPSAELWSLRSLSGTFAHAVFEQVLLHSGVPWADLSTERAEELALSVFETRLPLEAAPLALPAQRATTTRLRQTVVWSLARLVGLLKEGGWRPVAAEQDVSALSRVLDGQPLTGSIDLVVEREDGRRGVIDLKLGWARGLREKLRKGRALQLALYAYAVGGTPLPPVGYYVIEDGVLLATDAEAFPGASIVQGAPVGETLVQARETWSWARRVLEKGVIVARGPHVKDDAPTLDDAGAMVDLPPPGDPWVPDKDPCGFCDAKRLCTFSVSKAPSAGGAA